MVLACGFFVWFLALPLSDMPFRSSHLRYFLLLRHFVLNCDSPRYKGNFHSDIKTYRKYTAFLFCWPGGVGVLCCAETIAPLFIVLLYSSAGSGCAGLACLYVSGRVSVRRQVGLVIDVFS